MSDIWITGMDGGIGSACAKYLGHHRLITFAQPPDVTSKPFLINAALGMFEPEVLVYAAGVNHLDWVDEIDPEAMMHVYNVNVVGLVRCLQAAPSLRRVVVIGSDAANRPMRTSVAYNASKAALEAAVRVIAREEASSSQLVINIVAPGLVANTAMSRYVVERTRELRPELDVSNYMLDQIPMGRCAEPDEIARVVKWLVDDAPNYLNGSTITVNGAR